MKDLIVNYNIRTSMSIIPAYKRRIIMGLCFLMICMLSCKDDGGPADQYYVMYKVNSSTIYSGGKLDVEINTERGHIEFVIPQRSPWELTIGPVPRGFKAQLRVNAIGVTQDRLTLYTEIHVSKNNDPFALKAHDGSDEERDQVSLDYTIDY